MWAGTAHLLLGNLFIGIFEGILLARVFHLQKIKTIPALIIANYASAWGTVFLSGSIVFKFPADLNSLEFKFWLLVIVTYLFTLVVEYPFVAIAFRGKELWFRKSITGSLLIQTCSYVVLFGWYWAVSDTSLIKNAHVVSPSSIALPQGVDLYFINASDGDVYSMDLGSRNPIKVAELNSTSWRDRLLIRPSAADPTRWDLIARIETDDQDNPKLVTVKETLSCEAPAPALNSDGKPYTERETWFTLGKAPRLEAAKGSPWEFSTGFWAPQGLLVENKGAREQYRIVFDTPFFSWYLRNAIHLPGDIAVFVIVQDQICVFERQTKQVALLAKGWGPVAVRGHNK